MVQGIATVWLPVNDMDRATGFYADTLGLQLKDNHGEWAELEADGITIGLNARDEERPYLGDTTAFAYLERMAPLVASEPLALTPRGELVVQRKDRWDDRPPHPLGGVADITLWRYRLESDNVIRRATASAP